jgi:hypothetical protein
MLPSVAALASVDQLDAHISVIVKNEALSRSPARYARLDVFRSNENQGIVSDEHLQPAFF